MKCMKCGKPATFHITDIEGGQFQAYHLCEEHARLHLEPAPEETGESAMGKLAKELSSGGSSASAGPTDSDKQSCPICQTTFLDFRNSGRLGCPYDYVVFRDELMPLLENIHEETRHAGKTPRCAPRNTEQQTTLIQLRNDLNRAVAAEDYEAAAKLRDQIKAIEREHSSRRTNPS